MEGFGWVLLQLLCTSNKSLCCTCFCSPELPLEEERGPAGEADVEHQAKALLDAPPSPPVLQKAAGTDTVLGWERAEVGQLHKHWDKVSRVGG